MMMDNHKKLPEQQSLSTTRQLSGELRASRYTGLTDSGGWIFIDPEKEEETLINRIRTRGQCRPCYEQKSAWYSRFKGYYAHPSVVEEERAQLKKERRVWLSKRNHLRENLAVYEIGDWKKDGVSEGRFGRIPVPKGWLLLEAGDAFLTRRVKSRGRWWEYRRKLKTKAYDVKLGNFAPIDVIEEERKKLEEERSTESYKQRLETSRRARQTKEDKYRDEFSKAVFRFLNFASEHKDLAWQIAQGVASLATEPSSGRVGRTGTLPLEKKAELAARAYVRHNHTDYEELLANVDVPLETGDSFYREIRGVAQQKVDKFLALHR